MLFFSLLPLTLPIPSSLLLHSLLPLPLLFYFLFLATSNPRYLLNHFLSLARLLTPGLQVSQVLQRFRRLELWHHPLRGLFLTFADISSGVS
jgi:hypothetical protein